MKKFFKNVRQELKKVKWPNRKATIKYSIATLAIIVFFFAFFTASDFIIMGLKELMK